ncbi:MAG: double-strand break repair helicase AddA [Alphaproteobacteria bacterium]|nr:MAG: double-strand break repair helicase AddA [Alphaproteobacteria bacterium]
MSKQAENNLPHVAEATRNQIAAANPQVSAWVSANAGSGKTRVLTNRVVRLLLADVDPSRILCLTFTKAAAAEMANRLFAQLGEWSTMSDDKLIEAVEKLEGRVVSTEHLVRARRLFARAIETPGGLKIQTIHAFAQTILGRFPIEASVTPHFEVAEEQTAAELLAAARWSVIEKAQEGVETSLSEAVRGLTSRLSEYSLDQLLKEMIDKAARLKDLLPISSRETSALQALARRLEIEGLDEEEILSGSIDVILNLQDDLTSAADVLQSGSVNDQKAAAKIRACLQGQAEGEAYETYRDLLLKKDGNPRVDIITKKSAGAHPSIEAMLRMEQHRMFKVEQQRKAFDLLDATKCLAIFSAQVLGEFASRKARAGVLDYDDLIEKTADLLDDTTNAWVHFKLDGGIDHILVDEAQDTSPGQWRIIRALAEEFFSGASAFDERSPALERTIFAVGDEKQSIYSFQGAEPKAFEEERQSFERKVESVDREFSNLELLTSFRSTPQILKAVDQCFAEAEDAKGLSSAGHRVAHFAKREDEPGLVELWPSVKPVKREESLPWDAPLDRVLRTSPRARLAGKIADTIEGWLEAQEPVIEGGAPIRPGDILILVRRRDAFVDEMIRALKLKNIPVAGIDRMVLTDQMVVMDLMALADFALLPEDDLTLAEVLRSPLVGLTEEELFNLAWNRKGSLWQSLEGRRAENKAFGEAHAFLLACLARVETMAPFEFFREALISCSSAGVSAHERLLERLGPEAADPLEEFIGLTLAHERQEGRSLQGFMKWVREDASEIKREFDLEKNEVRVMTVHGAKGLEGRIVFLPDTCATPSSQNDDEIFFVGDEDAPETFLWRQGSKDEEAAIVSDLRAKAADKRMEEYRRLFYVAMTRAQDRLYICGYESTRARPPECWYALAERQLPLMEGIARIETEEGEIWRLGKVPVTAAAPKEGNETSRPPLPDWVSRALPPEEGPERRAPSQMAVEEGESPHTALASPVSETGADPFKRGRIIHALLEYLPGVAVADAADLGKRFLARQGLALSAKEQADIWRETSHILEDPAFAPIFQPGSLAEVPIMGRWAEGGAMIRGQMDRLVVTSDEVLVVDYKTNRPPPSRPEDVAEAYKAQMATYRALLRQIYPGRAVLCALLWTHTGQLMPLSDEILDESVKSLRGKNV